MKCVNTQLGWSVTFGSVAVTCRVADNTHTHRQRHTHTDTHLDLCSKPCHKSTPLSLALPSPSSSSSFEAQWRSFAQLFIIVKREWDKKGKKERSCLGDDENQDYSIQISAFQ